MTTFDLDTYRSNDFAAFLRLILGPVTGPADYDPESYNCDGCRDQSYDLDLTASLPAPDLRCIGCIDSQLHLRGLIMNCCYECGGMQGVMPIRPGQRTPEPFHWHECPLVHDQSEPFYEIRFTPPHTVSDPLLDLLNDTRGGDL
jgi:hypothetical protein